MFCEALMVHVTLAVSPINWRFKSPCDAGGKATTIRIAKAAAERSLRSLIVLFPDGNHYHICLAWGPIEISPNCLTYPARYSCVGCRRPESALLRGVILLLLAVALLAFVPGSPLVPPVSGDVASALYLSPVKSSTAPPGGGTKPTFSVNVNLNLSSTDTIACFEVYMRYNQNVLNATHVYAQPNYVFPPDRVYNASFCVNNVGVGCSPLDGPGNVVHLNWAYYDNPISGSFTDRTLFTVQFTVIGIGHSVFEFFNDSIFGPTGASAIHLTWNGIYSNSGLQAFFNVAPAILLVGRRILFDASSSFNPDNRTLSYNSTLLYTWDFGDGTIGTGMAPTHIYNVSRTYSVSLTVQDYKNTIRAIQRTLSVVAALGTIQIFLTDMVGNNALPSVTLKLFNYSVLVETATRSAGSKASITLAGLSPGPYRLDFSGPLIVDASKQENVIAGYTTVDTVSLSVKPYPARPDLALYLFLGTAASAPVIGSIVLFRRRVLRNRVRRAARLSSQGSRKKRS